MSGTLSRREEAITVVVLDPDGEFIHVEQTLCETDTGITAQRFESLAAVDSAPDCVFLADRTDWHGRLDRVTDRWPSVPVAAVVAEISDRFIREARDAGAEDVIYARKRGWSERSPAELVRRVRRLTGTGGEFEPDGKLLDDLMEYVPHQVFVKDETLRIEAVSEATASERGLSREQLRGLSDLDLFDADTARSLWQEEQEILETEEGIDNQIEHYVDDDGRDHWVSITKRPRYDDDGNVIGLVGTVHDETEQKSQEQAMRALDAGSSQLITADSRSEVAAIAIRIASDVAQLPNAVVALVEDGALAPVAVSEQLSCSLFEQYESQFHATLESGETTRIEPRPSAVLFPLGRHGVLAIESDSGALSPFTQTLAEVLATNVAAALDRLAKTDELRQRQQNRKRQNERLTEFTQIVSRDLRHPLAEARSRLAEIDAEETAEIRQAIDRMSQMTGELLTLAQEGEIIGSVEPVSVPSVVADAWKGIDAETAELTVDDDLGSIEADANRLTELFENLFRNAIEHAHEPDDPVTVTVGELDCGGLYIADDGPGIEDSRKESVLGRGVTYSESGTGMGLYIVTTIATAHGWDVAVADSDDGGVRIELRTDSPADTPGGTADG